MAILAQERRCHTVSLNLRLMMKNQHHAGKKRFLLCMLQRASSGIAARNRSTNESQPGLLPSTVGRLVHKIIHTDDEP